MFSVKTIQYFLLQTVLDFDAGELPHEDEAGFNLAKTRRRGRNVVGQRAVVNVPGQRGGKSPCVLQLVSKVSCITMPL